MLLQQCQRQQTSKLLACEGVYVIARDTVAVQMLGKIIRTARQQTPRVQLVPGVRLDDEEGATIGYIANGVSSRGPVPGQLHTYANGPAARVSGVAARE